MLAQYLRQDGRDVRCIDTDPVNRTFAQYAALAADWVSLRDEHNRIEQRAFDALMERFLAEETAMFVVDNGASAFLSLWHYILENDALEYLREHGRRVYVHTVITGGQALFGHAERLQRTGANEPRPHYRRMGERMFSAVLKPTGRRGEVFMCNQLVGFCGEDSLLNRSPRFDRLSAKMLGLSRFACHLPSWLGEVLRYRGGWL